MACKLEWCARCYTNLTNGSTYPGHRWYQAPPKPRKDEYWMSTIRRAAKPAEGGKKSPDGADHIELGSMFPAVREFLFLRKWDDGTARKPGTILLFVDDSGLKACLNDKDGLRTAFGVLNPSETILDALEAMLLADTTDWRDSDTGRKRAGK